MIKKIAVYKQCRRAGLTLVELLVVLVILIAVSGLLVVNFNNPSVKGVGGTNLSANEAVTLATMRELEKTLIGGGSDQPSFFQDVGFLPERLASLFIGDTQDADGDPVDDVADNYNVVTKVGWRGPYLLDEGYRYGAYNPGVGSNFTEDYAIDSDPVVLDGFGRPIVMQQASTEYARIVSAGKNGVLETDPESEIDGNRGDDIVRFLRATDPNL
jgi:type II secretory pathway pseudopilin PulG